MTAILTRWPQSPRVQWNETRTGGLLPGVGRFVLAEGVSPELSGENVDAQHPCDGCSKQASHRRKGPRVTFVTPTLGLGGAEQFARMLVTNSREIAWSVLVVNPHNWHPHCVGPISQAAEVFTVGRPGPEDPPGIHWCCSLSCAARSAFRDAELVCHWGGGFDGPFPQTPLVFISQGQCEWTRRAFRKAVSNGTTHLVGCSQSALGVLDDLHPPEFPARVIWNGVDERRVCVEKDPRTVRREVWRLPEHWFDYTWKYAGYCGRLSDEKNVQSVIEAVAQLPNYYRAVLIGGTGTARDEVLRLAKHRLGDRCTLVEAVDDIGNHLNALDCLVQVSPREGNSLTICEAMHVGVPIVTTRTGAIDEFEESAGGQLYWSVPPDPTAQETAVQIRAAVTSGRSDRRVRRAREFARRNLTAERIGREWSEYLLSLIKEHKNAKTG